MVWVDTAIVVQCSYRQGRGWQSRAHHPGTRMAVNWSFQNFRCEALSQGFDVGTWRLGRGGSGGGGRKSGQGRQGAGERGRVGKGEREQGEGREGREWGSGELLFCFKFWFHQFVVAGDPKQPGSFLLPPFFLICKTEDQETV